MGFDSHRLDPFATKPAPYDRSRDGLLLKITSRCRSYRWKVRSRGGHIDIEAAIGRDYRGNDCEDAMRVAKGEICRTGNSRPHSGPKAPAKGCGGAFRIFLLVYARKLPGISMYLAGMPHAFKTADWLGPPGMLIFIHLITSYNICHIKYRGVGPASVWILEARSDWIGLWKI
jgi:hypothetical protein